MLEAHGFDTWLVNARDVKHLPGRPKTDRLDAVWLCKVAERQMIRPSFVPPPPIRRLRDRHPLPDRPGRGADRGEEPGREAARGRLASSCRWWPSDIFGVSGRAMMAALIAGERDPGVLAQLARTRMRTRIAALRGGVHRALHDHHAFLLATMLARVDAIDADIAADRRPDRGDDRPFRLSGGTPR